MPSSIWDWWTTQMLWHRNLQSTSFSWPCLSCCAHGPGTWLDHAEGRFGVAALVIVPEKFVPAKLEVVEHLGPNAVVLAAVHLERDESRSAQPGHQFQVVVGQVGF